MAHYFTPIRENATAFGHVSDVCASLGISSAVGGAFHGGHLQTDVLEDGKVITSGDIKERACVQMPECWLTEGPLGGLFTEFVWMNPSVGSHIMKIRAITFRYAGKSTWEPVSVFHYNAEQRDYEFLIHPVSYICAPAGWNDPFGDNEWDSKDSLSRGIGELSGHSQHRGIFIAPHNLLCTSDTDVYLHFQIFRTESIHKVGHFEVRIPIASFFKKEEELAINIYDNLRRDSYLLQVMPLLDVMERIRAWIDKPPAEDDGGMGVFSPDAVCECDVQARGGCCDYPVVRGGSV